MNHNENARYCRYVREHGLCMNTLAETEEAYAIEQDLRGEWGRCLSRGLIGHTEPLAISVWDEYFQPELERKLKAIRKPYDQEADVTCSDGPCEACQCETPQQATYESGRIARLQQCNARQFEMIGDLREQVEFLKKCNDKQYSTLSGLREEICLLRNTWSPPPTYPPGPFHAVADLEQIRVLTAENHQLTEERDYAKQRLSNADSLNEQNQRNLQEYEDRLNRQRAIIERAQRLSYELNEVVIGN